MAPYFRATARLSQRYSLGPLLRVMGFRVSQHGQIGCDTHRPSMRTSGAIRPVQDSWGVCQRYLHDTIWKQGKNACETPSATLSRQGIARYGVGILLWAAKPPKEGCGFCCDVLWMSCRTCSKTSICTSKFEIAALWPTISPTDPQTPENPKTEKSDSKVTFGLPAKVTQSYLKVT